MKKDIKKAEWHHLAKVLPYKEVLDILEVEYGKRERKHLEDYMVGQTMSFIGGRLGIYVVDLMRFMRYRKQKLTGKKMPLDD